MINIKSIPNIWAKPPIEDWRAFIAEILQRYNGSLDTKGHRLSFEAAIKNGFHQLCNEYQTHLQPKDNLWFLYWDALMARDRPEDPNLGAQVVISEDLQIEFDFWEAKQKGEVPEDLKHAHARVILGSMLMLKL